jgi:hypothetical protein
MTRTRGARDLKKRKTRSDKRKKHRGDGNMVRYSSRRNRDAPLRIWWWQRLPMSKEGYRRWTGSLRPHVKKVVTRFVGRPISVEANRLSNVEAIEQLAVETIQYDGEFILMMPSHAKNSFHVCYKKKAKVKIVDTEEGLKAKVIWIGGIRRYWFYRGK